MCQILEILNGYPKKHGKTIPELADMLGYDNHSTLERHLNHNDHSRPFPLSKLIPLIKACNNDMTALDLIEKRLGRVAIQIKGNGEDITIKSLARLAVESGDVISKLGLALEDGILTEEEKRACSMVMLKLAQTIHTILEKLNQ